MDAKTKERKEILRYWVRQYEDVQNTRIRTCNRLNLKKNGEKTAKPLGLAQYEAIGEHHDTQQMDLETAWQWEKRLLDEISSVLEDFPIWSEFLKNVCGVGPVLAGWIIAEYDIEKATTVSKLWAYTGVAPGLVYGRKFDKKNKQYIQTQDLIPRDRLTPGYLSPFNKKLRSKMCGVLAASFLRSGSPYRQFYDNYKHRLEAKEGWKDEKPGHRDKAAKRYMIKQFLRDLYVAWRTIEGLPVRKPYEEEYLGKRHE